MNIGADRWSVGNKNTYRKYSSESISVRLMCKNV